MRKRRTLYYIVLKGRAVFVCYGNAWTYATKY
jgi:hypothetical protein